MLPTFTEWLKAAEQAHTADIHQGVTDAAAALDALPDSALRPVLVIGAGPGGLAVMAELSARSIPFICFEQHSEVGGMWDTSNPMSPVFPSLTSNSSKYSMHLDRPFDMPQQWPMYLSASQAHRYLQDYAEKHRLRQNIRFRCRVEQAQYLHESQRWSVRYRQLDLNTEQETDEFSDVITATGQNNRASADIPDSLKQQAKQAGIQVQHSSQFRHHSEYDNKRVLVLGMGISGACIATEVSKSAKATLMSVRTPQYILPLWFLGYPLDQLAGGDLPNLTSLPHWLSSAVLWLGRHVLRMVEHMMANSVEALGIRRPTHSLLDKAPVADDGSFQAALKDRRIVLRPEVAAFKDGRAEYVARGNRAVEVDVDSEEIDCVIFATGFRYIYPYLPSDLAPTTTKPMVIDTGRRPSACIVTTKTLTSSLSMLIISPSNRHLYFMTEVTQAGSSWPIFVREARAIVALLRARRRGSDRAARFDRVRAYPNIPLNAPLLQGQFWKHADEYFVERSLYVQFITEFVQWIED
jgi:cation diffusion facilitator CzcD-associated flavoprotein CzcO